MSVDLSIIIVHTFEKRMIRQTLRGIRRAAPRLHYEVIVVDNRPEAGMADMLRREFPDVRYTMMDANRGFGAGMNKGMSLARGRYVLIFNPDIVVRPGSLEGLCAFMDARPDVGIVGPKLMNPDGTVQSSCYRFHSPLIPLYRRTPLGRLPVGRKAIADFLMQDFDHASQAEVDWLLGAALFTRRSALDVVGGFDDDFFLYFEDTDLCRRFWEKGLKVVYYPEVSMVHYHRRASSDGSLWQQLRSRTTREHIKSWIRYFRKYAGKPNPRELQPPSHPGAVAGSDATPAAPAAS